MKSFYKIKELKRSGFEENKKDTKRKKIKSFCFREKKNWEKKEPKV